ncbi:MAG TPA: hypothetical protein VFB06_29570 [Streptosporangiaceae bacterium]|nr:hypothetical protein [Streptosporangiaceae bacterium]
MPRHRRPKSQPEPAPALVICLDTFHRDEPGYAKRGYHLVGELRPVPGGNGSGRLAWTGPVPERGPVRTPGMTIAANLAPDAPPVKHYRHGDAPPPWRFRCSCGLDKQSAEATLAAFITAWARKYPGRRCLIPLQRL